MALVGFQALQRREWRRHPAKHLSLKGAAMLGFREKASKCDLVTAEGWHIALKVEIL
jgi:hypothetical protein